MLLDQHRRPLRTLRLSVTDRCNLRCAYCMPEPDYVWLPREDLLQFEELERLARLFLRLGVRTLRLTGGEPLLRRDVADLVARLARLDGLDDLAMTTNGILLAPQVDALKAAGLRRLTVSLDTLHADRFERLARSRDLPRVLEGIAAAAPVFPGLKLDSVIIRGVNDDELVPLIEFARPLRAEVRFIEYMDVGGATHWSAGQVVSRDEMLAALTRHYGPVTPVEEHSSAPAVRYRLPDGTTIGIIASTTEPFCAACDRSRLTADGQWFLCLYGTRGLDLRGPVRGGATDEAVMAAIEGVWTARTDRGAEARLAAGHRGLIPVQTLRRDPHLEMHTRGG